jgi:hypothetical protein
MISLDCIDDTAFENGGHPIANDRVGMLREAVHEVWALV